MNLKALRQRFSSTAPASPEEAPPIQLPEPETQAPAATPPAPLTALPAVSHWIDPDPWIDFSTVPMAHSVENYRERDVLPIPPTANREGYHGERHYDYWLSGLKDYLQIKARTAPLLPTFEHGVAVLDFGCASGRVLRHFLCQEPAAQLWGCDLNLEHIRWGVKFLGSRPRFFPNTTQPTLPIEDNALDLIYAMSVFTHIDDYELTWLAELRRILKPGGVAYITVHTDHTWQVIGPNHALYYALMWLKDKETGYDISDELFAAPMPEERIAFTWAVGDHREANVFHSQAYLHAQWGKFFHIVDFVPEGSDYQDVVILQKR